MGQKSPNTSIEKRPVFTQFVVRSLRQSGLYAHGSINGTGCLWVIDTGAEVTVVRSNLLDPSANMISPASSLRTATGETTPVLGRSFVSVDVAGYIRSPHEVFVADIEDDGILGIDFLSAHKCVISTEDNTLRSRQLTLPLRTTRYADPSLTREAYSPALRGLGHDGVEQSEPAPASLPGSDPDHQRIVRPASPPTSVVVPDLRPSIDHPDAPTAPHLLTLFQISSSSLDTSQVQHLAALLRRFSDTFAKHSGDIGRCTIVKHRINVGDSSPIKQGARRLPLHGREEVEKLVTDMRTNDVIEPSNGPWASPIVIVPKKDGSKRFCIDYRELNKITKKDSYPLPRIEDTLEALAGAHWYSTIDLQSGYWQVEMAPTDKEKTAFVTGLGGLWQFKVMPFGLCNAPATFERVMETALQGLTRKICLVYLDDIIVFGQTFEEELANVAMVFQRLGDAGLKMSPKKCNLFQKRVKFLGHIVSSEGIQTDPEKLSVIRDWPTLTSKLDVQSFVGLCTYYRRFVQGFASIAKPLHRLTGEKVPFSWDTECEGAFLELKVRLTSAPILAFPRPDIPFVLDTDASLSGIGAVLSQTQEKLERVIGYFSRVLSRTERNYCVTRRELLAIVKAMVHFHHYLYGRRFLVRTDHASLRWLLSFKNPEGQVARWLQRLGIYDFEIQHRPGRLHGNADALSRRPCEEAGDCRQCARLELQRSVPVVVRALSLQGDSEAWKIAQDRDVTLQRLRRWKVTGERPNWEEISSLEQPLKVYWAQWDSLFLRNDLLYRRWESTDGTQIRWQLVVPRAKVPQVLAEHHDSPSGGHFAVNKTLERIRERYFWARCRSDVEEWCRTCHVCAARKGPRGKGSSPMQTYNVGAPFERVAMDILGPLPETRSGNRVALVMADYFTKWPEIVALPDQRAETVARAFVTTIVCRFGSPLQLHTDVIST